MLLVIPVSTADKGLIPTVKKAFSLLPPGIGHSLLIVGFDKVRNEIVDLQEALDPYFQNSSNLILQSNPSLNLGWPREGNYLFQKTAFHVPSHYNPSESFFWFELDCTPIKSNWLTVIAKEYYADSAISVQEKRAVKKYMGAKMPTIQARNGELIPEAQAGHHMSSCGVYPNDMAMTVKSLNAIPASGVPFSDFIQWYVLPVLKDTPLIQDNWRTKNYNAQENVVFSENFSEHAFGKQFNQPICLDAQTLLVHGCKDGSLLNEVERVLNLKPSLPEIQSKTSYKLPEETFTPTPQRIPLPVFQPAPAPRWNDAAPPTMASVVASQPVTVRKAPVEEEIFRLPDGERPMNSFAVGNANAGEAVPTPVLQTPRQKPVLLNNNPVEAPEISEPTTDTISESEACTAKPQGKKRGPYGKRKKKRNISPEARQRSAERMAIIGKERAERIRAEKAQKLNG